MPPQLQALKQEAERRINEWATTGSGLISSSLYDAAAWYSTGLGAPHTHDAQIAFFPCGYNRDIWRRCLRVDADQYFDDASRRPGSGCGKHHRARQPRAAAQRRRGRPDGADPHDSPTIRMNYFADPRNMTVMVSVIRRAIDIVAHWPAHRTIGPLLIPPFLAKKHGHLEGQPQSDALLEDLARHYALTVYHLTSTCRMGDVVDPRLRVIGVGLHVADASIMPNVISGNTNAPCIMIGEKAAEMLALDHAVKLAEFVGERR